MPLQNVWTQAALHKIILSATATLFGSYIQFMGDTRYQNICDIKIYVMYNSLGLNESSSPQFASDKLIKYNIISAIQM